MIPEGERQDISAGSTFRSTCVRRFSIAERVVPDGQGMQKRIAIVQIAGSNPSTRQEADDTPA
jgi:hypothetical protein